MKRPERWPAGVASLHWLGAAAILTLLALGLVMTKGEFGAARRFDLYQLHKSVGWLTLMLTLARLALRAMTPAPAALEVHSPTLRRLAGATHAALYALALIVGFSGWARVSSAVVPIPIGLFGLADVPAIAPMNLAVSEAMANLHAVAAYALAGLVALHAAAALKHHWLDRDATLRRMSLGTFSRGG